MIVFIGSVALNKHLPTSMQRRPKDTDLLASSVEEASNFFVSQGCTIIKPINNGKTLFGKTLDGRIFEAEICYEGTTGAEFLKRYTGDEYLPLDFLYMFKMSHRYLRNSPHFHKTRQDIHLMRYLGAKMPEGWEDWYKAREKATYWYNHPSLKTDKKEFIKDVYQYDHDTLHEAVALYGAPAYKSFLADGAQVDCDRAKFDALPMETRLAAVVEESMVLALERSLVPHAGKLTERQAFELALSKACTSITSGWFREFAWEHFEQASTLFNYHQSKYRLLDRLKDGVAKGIVKESEEWLAKSM